MIHAILHLVVQMLNVIMVLALVYKSILVILTLDADLNVCSILTAKETKLVSEINALIHVLELAARMLSVM